MSEDIEQVLKERDELRKENERLQQTVTALKKAYLDLAYEHWGKNDPVYSLPIIASDDNSITYDITDILPHFTETIEKELDLDESDLPERNDGRHSEGNLRTHQID